MCPRRCFTKAEFSRQGTADWPPCFDAKTGKPFYLEERLGALGDYYASRWPQTEGFTLPPRMAWSWCSMPARRWMFWRGMNWANPSWPRPRLSMRVYTFAQPDTSTLSAPENRFRRASLGGRPDEPILEGGWREKGCCCLAGAPQGRSLSQAGERADSALGLDQSLAQRISSL